MSSFVYVLKDSDIKQRYQHQPQPPQFNYLPTANGKIFYVTNGDSTKPLLVLIHGAPGHWYSSINLLEDTTLLQHYYILTYDRPGFGKSNNGHSLPYVDVQAEMLHKLITKVNINQQPITVMGRSYGTAIAARYAMLYPQKTKKLLLLASCIDPKKERYFWFTYLNKWNLANLLLPKDIEHTSDEKFAHRKELKKIQNDWYKITAPTYIMHGTKDWIADTANAFYAMQKIVNAPTTLYVIQGTGHNVTWKHSNIIKQWLLE